LLTTVDSLPPRSRVSDWPIQSQPIAQTVAIRARGQADRSLIPGPAAVLLVQTEMLARGKRLVPLIERLQEHAYVMTWVDASAVA
jgi:hypothetical protein